MKTTYEDKALEQELQELYILSKHWLQDIAFIEDEVRFFKNILHKYLTPVLQNEVLIKMTLLDENIKKQEKNICCLEENVKEYLKVLGPYINDETKVINVSLIEKFSGLQADINALFLSAKNTKRQLFACTEEILNAQKNMGSVFQSREAI